MKTLIIMLTLTTSLSSLTVRANERVADVLLSPIRLILAPFAVSTTGGMTTSGKECELVVCKEAGQIVEDSQDYLQTGELTVYLGQKIKDIQSTDESLSEVEALEFLVKRAVEILK
ncbi:MAG: hypothetical protein Q7U04_02065 [Bacteriovorax sp.]|nr:hypothetical protein [Bacteriovorax sp.]